MVKQIMLLILAAGWMGRLQAQAPGQDTATTDSSQLSVQLQIQEQQNRLDSLVKINLQQELSKLSEDSKRRRELEQQLQRLTRTDSIRKAERNQQIIQLRKTAKGSPVTLLEDTLFLVYIRIGSFNPQERAAAITGKVRRLYDDSFFNPDSLQLVTMEGSIDIVYKGELVLMSVTETDALFAGSSQQQLSAGYLATIRDHIIKAQKANSWANWLRRLGFVALIMAAIALVIWAINRLFRMLAGRLVRKKDKYFNGLHLRYFKLFNPGQHLRFVLRLLSLAKLIVIMLTLYLSLPLLFSIFPQTEEYTYTLINWILSPAKSVLQGILHYLPKLFTILIVYLFTRYAIKVVRYLANGIQKGQMNIKGFYSDWAQPTYNIIRFLLYALMLVIIFPYLPGSGSPAFQGVSVFLGILFSLGSSSAISNIVAGLVITYMRPFRLGDRVQIGEITGDVVEKSLLVTRIRTIKNEEVTVPNASVLSNHTTNYTKGSETNGLIIHTNVTIGYDEPWQKVHAALIKAAAQTPLVEAEPAPFVMQTALEDFYVSYQINAYTKYPASLAQIYSDLYQQILDCCHAAGIEIMSPHYQAIRDGNNAAIPPK